MGKSTIPDRAASLGSAVKRDGEKHNARPIGDVEAPSAPILGREFPLQFIDVARDRALRFLKVRDLDTFMVEDDLAAVEEVKEEPHRISHLERRNLPETPAKAARPIRGMALVPTSEAVAGFKPKR